MVFANSLGGQRPSVPRRRSNRFCRKFLKRLRNSGSEKALNKLLHLNYDCLGRSSPLGVTVRESEIPSVKGDRYLPGSSKKDPRVPLQPAGDLTLSRSQHDIESAVTYLPRKQSHASAAGDIGHGVAVR